MKYTVKLSKLKVVWLFLLGLILVPVSLFVMNFLYETSLFGKLIIILWVLLGLMLLISALLIPVSLALLVRYPGTYMEMSASMIETHVAPIGKVKIPWKEVEKIGLAGAGKTQSLVITVANPEPYISALQGFKRSSVNYNSQNYGTPFVVSLRFLDQSPQNIYEKALEFWNDGKGRNEMAV